MSFSEAETALNPADWPAGPTDTKRPWVLILLLRFLHARTKLGYSQSASRLVRSHCLLLIRQIKRQIRKLSCTNPIKPCTAMPHHDTASFFLCQTKTCRVSCSHESQTMTKMKNIYQGPREYLSCRSNNPHERRKYGGWVGQCQESIHGLLQCHIRLTCCSLYKELYSLSHTYMVTIGEHKLQHIISYIFIKGILQ